MRSLSAWVSLASVVAAACGRPDSVELLVVDSAQPDQLAVGSTMVLEGEGFAAGRPARVVFDGVVRRPGQGATEVVALAEGIAVSAQRIEVPFTADWVETLGGRGTFEGTLRVEFDAADGAQRVTGSLADVRFGFLSRTADRLRRELADTARAEVLLAGLGIVPQEDDDPEGQGLGIGHVVPGSAAERAGLLKGDRLLGIEGMRVDALSDFVPPPRTSPVTLDVARVGDAAILRVAVEVNAPARPALSDAEFLAATLLFALLLVVVLVRSPLTAPLLSTTRAARRRGLGLVDVIRAGRGASRGLRLGGTLLGMVTTAAIPIAIPIACFLLPVGPSAAALVLATVIAQLALELVRHRDQPFRSWWQASLTGLIYIHGPVLCALGGVMALLGSLQIDTIVNAQGGWPWQWLGLRHPVAFFMLAPLLTAIAPADRPVHALGRVVDRLRVLVLSGLVVCLFLGGWQLPPVDALEGSTALHLGSATLLYSIKVIGVLAIMDRIRTDSAPSLRVLSVSLVCLALACGSTLLVLPPRLEQAFGLASAAVFATLLLVALVRALQPRTPGPDLYVHR